MAGNTVTTEIKVDLSGNGGEKTIGELRAQYKELFKSIGDTVEGTQQYYEKLQQLGQAKGAIRELREQIKSLDPRERFKLAADSLKGLAGGFEAAAGAAVLFGSKNEAVEETIKKLNGIIAISQGIQEFVNGLRKAQEIIGVFTTAMKVNQAAQAASTVSTTANTAATVAETAATEGQAVATEGATVATEALNATMALNPAVIITTAIIALVAAVAYFASTSEDADKTTKALNDSLKDQNEILIDLAHSYIGTYTETAKQAELQAEIAEKQGKGAKVVADLQKKAVEARATEARALLANLGLTQKEVEYNETLIQDRQEQLHAVLSLVDANGELSDKDKAREAGLRAQIEAVKGITEEGRKAVDTINDVKGKEALADAESTKKINDKNKEDAKKRADDLKKQIDAELSLVKEKGSKLEQINSDNQKKIGEATLSERQKEMSDLKFSYDQDLKVIADFEIAETKLLQDQLAHRKITEDQYYQQLAASNKKANTASLNLQTEFRAQQDNINKKYDQQIAQYISDVNSSHLDQYAQKAAEINKKINEQLKNATDKERSELEKVRQELLAANGRDRSDASDITKMSTRLAQTKYDISNLNNDPDLKTVEAKLKRKLELVQKEYSEEIRLEDAQYKQELDKLKASGQSTEQLTAEHYTKLNELHTKNVQDQKQLNDELVQNEQANLNQYSGILGSASKIAGEKSAEGKALGIAAATISTYVSAQKAFESQLIPGDPSSFGRAALAAGAAIIAGLARVAQIARTNTNSSGVTSTGADVSGGSPIGSSPVQGGAPTIGTSAQIVNLSSNSVNAITQQQQQPVQAVVVESQVTATQARVQSYQNASTH